jgi:sugar phosphate isomerase/epimerase
MRIATASYGFRQWSLENYLHGAAGAGVDFVEVGYTQHGTLQQLYWVGEQDRALAASQLQGALVDADGVARARALAAEAGVRMVSSAAEYRLWGVSPAWLDWAKANIRLDIEIGAQLGLEVMRVAVVGYTATTRESAVFDAVAGMGRVLNELAKHAEEFGVTIVCENFRASSDLMLAVASHFTSPNVGLHFDSHNCRRVGEDPVQMVRKLKDFVRYCHFKDFRPEDAHLTPTDTWWSSWGVGDGDINWRALLEELATFYDGIVAIEYEKSLHDVLRAERRGVELIRTLMRELGIREERLRA